MSATAPLAAAIIGVRELEGSAAFYRDIVGLQSGPIVELRGSAFADHWGLPHSARARAQRFAMPGVDIGAVTLIEFDAPQRLQIRRTGESTIRGLWNINFYVRDIDAACRMLAARGYAIWSEPTGYEVSAASGAPIEALFDGPDGVAINLVQLTGDASTVIGRVRAAVEAVGHTPTGWTAVSTTSHSVRDTEAAIAFYREVLGLSVLMDDVLDKPASNHFLRRPVGARTRATFMASEHPFGKIALSQALNYPVPDHVADAVAPNIGYLAQSFRVSSLDSALASAKRLGVIPLAAPAQLDAWGDGATHWAVRVAAPGSGASIQLVERPG